MKERTPGTSWIETHSVLDPVFLYYILYTIITMRLGMHSSRGIPTPTNITLPLPSHHPLIQPLPRSLVVPCREVWMRNDSIILWNERADTQTNQGRSAALLSPSSHLWLMSLKAHPPDTLRGTEGGIPSNSSLLSEDSKFPMFQSQTRYSVRSLTTTQDATSIRPRFMGSLREIRYLFKAHHPPTQSHQHSPWISLGKFQPPVRSWLSLLPTYLPTDKWWGRQEQLPRNWRQLSWDCVNVAASLFCLGRCTQLTVRTTWQHDRSTTMAQVGWWWVGDECLMLMIWFPLVALLSILDGTGCGENVNVCWSLEGAG